MVSDILVNIGSGNGLPPVRRQAITCTDVNLLTMGLLGTNLQYIYKNFLSRKMQLKM